MQAGVMRHPRGDIQLRRMLLRRLLPAVIGLAALISLGIPGVYYTVASTDLRHSATRTAQGVAARVQPVARTAPGRWSVQTHILQGFLDTQPLAAGARVEIVGAQGIPVARTGPTSVSGWWWEAEALVGSAPIIVAGRIVGSVNVWSPRGPLLRVTLGIFLLSLLLGSGVGALAVSSSLAAAGGVEHQMRVLLETARDAAGQVDRLREQLNAAGSASAARSGSPNGIEASLAELIASSPGVFWLGDPADFSLSYVSPTVERILGYLPEHVVARPGFWLDHIHPDYRDQFLAHRQRAMEGRRELLEYEVPFLHQDGTYRWLYCSERLEHDTARRAVRVRGHALDVSERKEVEEAYRRAKDEAERANRSKSEFLSRMSHELRTPLNAILGFAQLLEIDSTDPQQRESVERILKGGQHLLSLINEILDIARIEAGQFTVSLEAVALKDVLQECLALIGPLATEQRIELITAELGGCTWHVQADRHRLKQVFLNLLTNAIKYNRDGGAVALGFEEALDGRLRIRVSDTGHGIPADKMDRLFLPFSRLTMGHAGVDGTGIGLAISKGLVEMMGGTIGLESVVGQGSTFWVELPLADSPLDVYQHRSTEVSIRNEASPHSARTVLYIEDNLSNLELIQRVLAGRTEIQLISAMQGRLGLGLGVRHRPDLILLDMTLPDIPGEEVLRRLRDSRETRWVPVVVISADATQDRIDAAMALGARAYLTKPLDIRKLLALMDEVLGQTVTA